MLKFFKNTFQTITGIIIPAQALLLGLLLFIYSSGLSLEQQLVSPRWWTALACAGAVLVVLVLLTGIWAQIQLLKKDCSWWVHLAARAGTLMGSQILYWLAHMGQNFSQRTGLILDWGRLLLYDQSVLDQKRATYLEAMIKVYNASASLQCVPSQAQHFQKLSLKGLENQLTPTELVGLTLDQISMLATHNARQLIMAHMQGAPLLTFVEKFKFVYTPSLVQWVSDHPLVFGGVILFGGSCIFMTGAVAGWSAFKILGKIYLSYEQASTLVKYCVITNGAYQSTPKGLALIVLPHDLMFTEGVLFYVSSLVCTLLVSFKLVGVNGLLKMKDIFDPESTAWIRPVKRAINKIMEVYFFNSINNKNNMAAYIFDEVNKQRRWYFHWFSRNG